MSARDPMALPKGVELLQGFHTDVTNLMNFTIDDAGVGFERFAFEPELQGELIFGVEPAENKLNAVRLFAAPGGGAGGGVF